MCQKCVPKLEMVLTNLKNQNNGATVHEVNTMRHIAAMLIQLAASKPDYVCKSTKALSKREVEFFTKRSSGCPSRQR